jgi:hypothetical protein
MWRWTTEEARDDAVRSAIEEEEEEEEEDLEAQITIVNVIIPQQITYMFIRHLSPDIGGI